MKKLQLKKEVVAQLNDDRKSQVKGGDTFIPIVSIGTECPDGCLHTYTHCYECPSVAQFSCEVCE